MDNKKSFPAQLGQIVANIFVACIAACLTACMLALTVRFIMWLF